MPTCSKLIPSADIRETYLDDDFMQRHPGFVPARDSIWAMSTGTRLEGVCSCVWASTFWGSHRNTRAAAHSNERIEAENDHSGPFFPDRIYSPRDRDDEDEEEEEEEEEAGNSESGSSN